MNNSSNHSRAHSLLANGWLVFVLLLLTTLIVYWPALHGGYIFDDSIYFVDNPDVHVTTLRVGDWIKAALQQSGTNQFRALSMLSFAANYYFTGLDPYWVKLTNLGFHAINGILAFVLLRNLFQLWRTARPDLKSNTQSTDITAAVLTGAWLLLPINLTGVVYVSQRMESLANIFVFLGLALYARCREREFLNQGGAAKLVSSVLICMALGLSAKQSAVLLPLFTACLEFAITGFKNADGRYSKPALWVHGIFLVLPFIAGLVFVSGWLQHGIANFRSFSIGERLLTEPRVLVDYLNWTLLPNLSSLTFYHDDLAVSHGLLTPPTTLLAILFLLALLGIALLQHRDHPLFCLGVLWFFCGHSLTATVIPLELVFEHRNYFPSIGLLLAAASIIALEPGFARPITKAAIASLFIVFFSFTTLLRSQEWSDPLTLAYSEALKRPDSARSQYELARTLIIASGAKSDSPLITKSIAILQQNAYKPSSGITALQALIYISARTNREIDPHWWQAITEKLQRQAPSIEDIEALIFLFHCQRDQRCPEQKTELLNAFLAALSRSEGEANLMSAYADFALVNLGDRELAERMSREVVNAKPQVAVYRANLIRIYISTGQFDKAKAALGELATLNYQGSLDRMIANLTNEIATAQPTKSDSN